MARGIRRRSRKRANRRNIPIPYRCSRKNGVIGNYLFPEWVAANSLIEPESPATRQLPLRY